MRAYFHLAYRQAEGVVKAHAKKKVPSIPDYSTISRRVNKLDIDVDEHVGNDIVIAWTAQESRYPTVVNGCTINGE
ncbi:hypothetical protein Ngar_c09430 [Candidatus Nitrososphaera gargensis Ga9.2]|uniref:Transposase DDE domain-containing protein n=1 Tax=Nitrososphaera gargensis (strain Ga9.2) TaxID=1237085 RepID=K0IDT0_NITGG|nr:hypothetical protein Ngar_c09430 [Candidatus Nitrososphaera gargensis Ga9.2]